MKCWNCSHEMNNPQRNKLAFRALCDKCNAWLHCCQNCKHYKPGLPNDCSIPGTEYIADRQSCNFCEEFDLLGTGPQKKIDPNQISQRLFGDNEENNKNSNSKNNPFDSLFKDN